jgi:protoporphyrinogen oxidase
MVEGLAIPDFTDLSEEQKAKILYQQATQLASDETEYANLSTYLENRYGQTVSEILTPIVQKIAVADPTELDESTFQRTPINRIRVFDDQLGELLKQIPEFDDVLAVPSQEDPLRFYPEAEKQYPHKNYYPSENGMRGFVMAAADYIKDRGVEIVKNCEITDLRSANGSIRVGFEDSPEIETGNVVWTAGPDALAPLLEGGISWEYTHDVPMVLYYFFVPAQSDVDHTYIHDFRSDSTV